MIWSDLVRLDTLGAVLAMLGNSKGPTVLLKKMDGPSSVLCKINLIYREEEREMIPYRLDEGIASIHWSPLARGLLTGINRNTVRMNTDHATKSFFAKKESTNNDKIIDRVVEIAEKLGHSPAQVALAWMLTKPHCTSPIIVAGKAENLYDIIGSLDVKLSEEDIEYLEEPYIPRNLIHM